MSKKQIKKIFQKITFPIRRHFQNVNPIIAFIITAIPIVAESIIIIVIIAIKINSITCNTVFLSSTFLNIL